MTTEKCVGSDQGEQEKFGVQMIEIHYTYMSLTNSKQDVFYKKEYWVNWQMHDQAPNDIS